MRLKPALLLAALLPLTLLPAAPRAEAFCGFYVSGAEGALFNDATQVVLMREGQRTVLAMQNTYAGPPEDFAMVIPVPVILQEENVRTLDPAVFADVDRMGSPRLVEYWEQDPCNPYADEWNRPGGVRVYLDSASEAEPTPDEGGVKIEAQFKVGEYDVVILSASESTGLDRWLRANKYNIPTGAAAVLAPYIEQGLYFFVAKVDLDKVRRVEGRVALSPLRFHYDAPEFSLPIRLGLLNAGEQQDLLIHILARGQRYQPVNRPSVAIPTNIEVKDEVRARFGAFYNALFDRTLERHPGAVVTEYAWDASTCDPCPGPTLTPEHFLTLGADVLPGQPLGGFTLTRLHARYGKEDVKDDLIFAAAPPITGGREVYVDTNELEQGAQPAPINNFQGRYIIRHPWTGAVTCDNPQRGVWGGPPGSGGSPQITPAASTAFAPRGATLASLIAKPVEVVDAQPIALSEVANTEPLPVNSIPPQYQNPVNSGGCASCAVVADSPSAPMLALLGLAGALGLALARRR